MRRINTLERVLFLFQLLCFFSQFFLSGAMEGFFFFFTILNSPTKAITGHDEWDSKP